MSYPRNAASPERVSIGPVVQISDGAVQTSGVAVKVIPFGAVEASGTGTVAYSADGVVLYTPIQAETNYTSFILVASKSGCIPAGTTVVTSAASVAGRTAPADGSITAAVIATDAIDADAIKADAVTEIQSGLATSANVTDAQTAIITQIDANETKIDSIQSDTNDIQSRLPAALESGRIAAALDSASRLAIWNTLTTESFTADSFGELLLISDGTNGRAVKVTGANHIAADVHECQADGLTASTEITAINTFATRITTGIVQDGAVWQFTANMLELGPAGSGGSGDASQATLLAVKAKTDLIGTAAGATTLLAAAVLEPGTITSFPETLTIGDSYTEQNGRSIQIPIVDTDGNPISSTGSLDFANASVTFTLQRSGETDSTRVITGSASFVDPPGTGTGAGAPYAVIEIPASETAKGLKKYKYSGILTFTWTYAGTGTADDVMSFETNTVTFDN